MLLLDIVIIPWVYSTLAAVIKGATVIEKHFTLSKMYGRMLSTLLNQMSLKDLLMKLGKSR